MLAGVVFDLVWLLGLALTPWALGQAVDQGILAGDFDVVVKWAALLAGIAIVRAAAEAMRNRAGISNWNQAAFRSVQILGHHLTRSGTALQRSRSVGEILAVQGDAYSLAAIYFLLGGLTSALVSYSVVAVIVLRASVPLGIFVLVGVPLAGVLMSLVAKPLHRAQEEQRTASGEMTEVAADAVVGLRVLRGIGGEPQFMDRYRDRSARTLRTGWVMARPVALLAGLQVALGGVLVVVLTWMAGAMVVEGRLEPGQLLTFYGYAAFLLTPANLVADNLMTVVPAVVGSRRLTSLLRVNPAVVDKGTALPPPPGSALVDLATKTELPPTGIVGLVSPDLALPRNMIERIARADDDKLEDGVTWGGTDTRDIPLNDLRSRILLVDPLPYLFAGTLREAFDPLGKHSDAEIEKVCQTACASDVITSRPGGLDGKLVEGGRDLSGGQRQRVGLVRALLADPEVLLLDDVTSAVDAHTEERISQGITALRGHHRLTVLTTTSTLLLGRCDTVLWFGDDGLHMGSHAQLAGSDDENGIAAYRETVLRGNVAAENSEVMNHD